MRWTPGGTSSDVEDQRGATGGGGFGGGRIGIGGAIILLVLSLVFHKNFFALVGVGGDGATQTQRAAGPVQETAEEHKSAQFVSFVIDDIQSTWDKLLPEQTNKQYHHAKLDLFRDGIQTGCGTASSASGPFYCPEDERVYIDLAFYDELRRRFGAPGDFAQAYVIAHEVGHHVQNILGVSQKVERAMHQDPQAANGYSVRLELQADCYAGVWAHSTQQRNLLEAGDIDEALGAASAVGDDRIQKMTGRGVNPETWTHGSAKERSTWFRRGFDGGKMADCNTFDQ